MAIALNYIKGARTMHKIFTIGYSVAPMDLFLETIEGRMIVDVRAKPHSRWQCKYNKKAMTKMLGEKYISLPDLGGFGDEDPEKRKEAILKVKALLETQEVVLMCAEKDPRKCHRKALAEEISEGRVKVKHLIAPFKRTAQISLLF